MQNSWIPWSLLVLLVGASACSKDSKQEEGAAETATASIKAKPDEATSAPGKATEEASAAGAPTPTSEVTLKEGDPAPAVTLTLQDGKTVELASLKGKQVALYFYPKDDTPGCTVEAQGIRDAWESFEKADVQVFGVSLQDAASHQAFIEKHQLPFPLVVDTEGTIPKAFGVPVSGGEYAARHTFLIGEDGKVKKIWRAVDPKSHAAEVLEAASQSQAG